MTYCRFFDKPPISITEPDPVIALVTETSFNNSDSNDPDGDISNFLWTKMSGPVSFIFH